MRERISRQTRDGTDPRLRGEASRGGPPGGRLGSPVVARVLVVVFVVIAIGAAGVLSAGGGADRAVTHAAVSTHASPALVNDPSTSTGSSSLARADVSFLDLQSGEATSLPRSIRSIALASHFRISPDGSTLAFDDGDSIYVTNVDGSRIRRFTPGDGASAPSWSPNGRRVVFSEGASAYLLDVATGCIHRFIREHGQIWNPNFGDEGRVILYTTVRHRRLVMRTVPSTGGASSFLMRGAFGTYSPDGTTIAFRKTGYDGYDVTEMTQGIVWLADADGSHQRAIGNTTGWMSQIDPEALWPIWSPDGTRIAYQGFSDASIKVSDFARGRGTPVAEGSDPSWFDDHTLVVSDLKEVAS